MHTTESMFLIVELAITTNDARNNRNTVISNLKVGPGSATK